MYFTQYSYFNSDEEERIKQESLRITKWKFKIIKEKVKDINYAWGLITRVTPSLSKAADDFKNKIG